MRIGYISSSAAVLLVAAGCATHRTYTTPSGQVYEANHAADRALENSLRAQLRQYGDLAMDEPNIRIYARDGNVTLQGRVRDQRERDMIDTMVRDSAGVATVSDQLQVVYSPTGAASGYPVAPVYSYVPPLPAVPPIPSRSVAHPAYPDLRLLASTSADEVTARRIVDALHDNSVRPEWVEGVIITVTNGKADVQGSVDSSEERQAILTAVQSTLGVQAVYDQLKVR